MTTMRKLLFIILAVLVITGINALDIKKTYWKNGNLKSMILITAGKKERYEYTYWKNGNKKTFTSYSNGKLENRRCYIYTKDDYEEVEPCKRSKHGCTAKSKTCIK